MGLFDFLKPKKKEPLFKGRVFDYHEDDFCMVELVPEESVAELESDFKEINRIQDENKDQNGYSEIHAIEEKKIKLLDRSILISDLEKILIDSSLKKFDNVTTGYGSMQYDSEFSTAYSLEDDFVLIYERNKDKVDKIWFRVGFGFDDENYMKRFTDVVSEVSNKWNLSFVYWYDPVVIDSKDGQKLIEFLKKKN